MVAAISIRSSRLLNPIRITLLLRRRTCRWQRKLPTKSSVSRCIMRWARMMLDELWIASVD